MELDESNDDVADVVIRPPNLTLGCLAAAAILELIVPLGPGLSQGSWKPVVTGLIFVALGLVFGHGAPPYWISQGSAV